MQLTSGKTFANIYEIPKLGGLGSEMISGWALKQLQPQDINEVDWAKMITPKTTPSFYKTRLKNTVTRKRCQHIAPINTFCTLIIAVLQTNRCITCPLIFRGVLKFRFMNSSGKCRGNKSRMCHNCYTWSYSLFTSCSGKGLHGDSSSGCYPGSHVQQTSRTCNCQNLFETLCIHNLFLVFFFKH